MAKSVLVPQIPNGEITRSARASLKGRWFIAALILLAIFITEIVGAVVFEVLLNGAVKHILHGVVAVCCNNIAMLAYFIYCKSIADDDAAPDFWNRSLAAGFKQFVRITVAQVIISVLFFFGLLLLIVPGIIIALNYAMVPYILIDKPDVPLLSAFKRSRRLMYGHRWQAIRFAFRFVGWGILAFLTCGIGFLWLIPYGVVSYWKFYKSLLPEAGSEAEQEIPAYTPCKEMSLALRIVFFILFVLISAANSYKDELIQTNKEKYKQQLADQQRQSGLPPESR